MLMLSIFVLLPNNFIILASFKLTYILVLQMATIDRLYHFTAVYVWH
jgi:hypothetical protein